ncbi:hypothetical protein AcW1_006764 [Taiwanofungus camphoratus]|nr:hypothetical protein AcW1_006764 [Antrodia cinnamomea]
MPTPPSPSNSPTLTTHDFFTNNSRKRQRSQSMQSEPSSSSPKRAASDDPSPPSNSQGPARNSQFDDISALSITDSSALDSDIDSYMADQGETPSASASPMSQDPFISPADRLAAVEQLRQTPMEVGQIWYLVSRRWYKRWYKACSGEVDKEGPIDEANLGPVDNSPLVDKIGNLTSSCIEHVDVEFVPEQVWEWFVEWYGPPTWLIARKVVERGILREPTLELHPPRVRLHVLTPTAVTGVHVPPRTVSISASDTISTVCDAFGATLSKNLPSPRPHRVWRLPEGTAPEKIECLPADLKRAGGRLLVPGPRTVEEELIEAGDAFVVEFQLDKNNQWVVDADEVHARSSSSVNGNATASSSASQSSDATELTPPALFSPETDFFGQMQKNSSANAVSPSSTLKTSSYNSNSNANSSMTRSKGSTQEPGTLGLGNMGNTCFMNSALQCLTHTKELSEYFLSGVYEDELNFDNPLGMQGAIAQAFGALVRRIWVPSPSSSSALTSSYSSYSTSSFTPREFKQALQRFAPQFSGYQQHDTQELVAFLLDGLHEDLNRVLKKPYVEKPEWEGGGDKELVALAKESWDGYMKRNDSVIVDLFQGQYQSTLVCPECSKVSITFDPFMYLTLPLPVQKKWRHTILYIPWDLQKPHVKIPVEINRDASFKDLRQLLGRWMSVNPNHLLTLEVFSSRFYKNLDDTVLVGDMSDHDIITCFELPVHAQQSRTYQREDGDPFIVPVFLCDVPPPRQSYSRSQTLFGEPFIVVLDWDQATTPNKMYNAIAERLQRWTVHVRDLFAWEAGPASSEQPVQIPLAGPPAKDIVTEIKANGDIVTVQEALPEEGDIVDEKAAVVRAQDDESIGVDVDASATIETVPHKVGFKKNMFHLRVQAGNAPYGIGNGSFGPSTSRFDTWDHRREMKLHEPDADPDEPPVLLQDGDAFFCEFDENMKAYYFGDERGRWEHARFDIWEELVHPEYTASRKAAAEKKERGIALQDCLDEFTREERLGEDDLWYCPRCKKHQQATKRFDLWKVPDVLVVHLKRFSNSRTLRDKIDTFVDFPVEGLDLSEMVGERQVAKRLVEDGVDIAPLGLTDLEEPLIYDLYAVDEHLGGLGGGHYRAYALNHITEKWYHFDDSYVTPSTPEAAVNPNAYLLFYKKRTSWPLGGKSHAKIQEARNGLRNRLEGPPEEESQLSTQPNGGPKATGNMITLARKVAQDPVSSMTSTRSLGSDGWPTPQSNARSSPASSPPPLDDADPPSFADAQYDGLVQSSLDPLALSAHQFDFPDPSSRSSPASSLDVEPDLELEGESLDWPADKFLPVDVFPQDVSRVQNVIFARDGASSPSESSINRLSRDDMESLKSLEIAPGLHDDGLSDIDV